MNEDVSTRESDGLVTSDAHGTPCPSLRPRSGLPISMASSLHASGSARDSGSVDVSGSIHTSGSPVASGSAHGSAHGLGSAKARASPDAMEAQREHALQAVAAAREERVGSPAACCRSCRARRCDCSMARLLGTLAFIVVSREDPNVGEILIRARILIMARMLIRE